MPALAVGFACVFDAVMIATTWQYARRGAVELAQAAADIAAADQGRQDWPHGTRMDRAFARAAHAAAPADVLGAGAMVLRLRDETGMTVRQWQRGVMPLGRAARPAPGCPREGFQAELVLTLPDWLVAPPVVHAVLSVVRAEAMSCLPTMGAADGRQDHRVSG